MGNLNSISQRLSLGTKLGYGAGSLGEGLAYSVFQLYFIFFLTNYVGISPAIAGTISMLAILWDAVTDPIVGHLSDHSKNPKGKRRPFIAKFCLPLGIMIFLMFTDWSSISPTWKIAYFVVINGLFWILFTAVDVPYMTLGGEITDDPDEKVTIRSIATVFFYIGFVISSSGTMVILEKLAAMFEGDYLKAWSWVGILFGAIITCTYFISAIATKGSEKVTTVEETEYSSASNVSIIKSIVEAFKVKPYRNLLLYNFFFSLSAVFTTSSVIYVLINYLKFGPDEIGMAFLAYTICIIIFAPILGKVTEKIGNRRALLITVILAVINYLVFKVSPLTGTSIYIMQVCIAIGNAGFFVNSYAMVYEVGAFSSLKTGFKNDGILIAFYQFSYKLATAIAMWLVGITLTYYKYNPVELLQSDYTMNGLRNMVTMIPGIIGLVAIPFVLKYSLTPENIDRLTGMIKAKGEEKETNMVEVNKIL